MTEPLNLKLYRNSADAFAPSPRRYQAAFTMLAVPLMFGLGFVAFRTKRMRPLMSAFAVLGIARSAAQLLKYRSNELRDRHLDEAGKQSFPASDAPPIR